VKNSPALIQGKTEHFAKPKNTRAVLSLNHLERKNPKVKALLGQEKPQPSSPCPPPASVVFPWKSSQRKTRGMKKNLVFIKNLECEGFCSFQWGFDSYRWWNVFRTFQKCSPPFYLLSAENCTGVFSPRLGDRSGERWMQTQTLAFIYLEVPF